MNEEGTVNWNIILLGSSLLGKRVLDILAAVRLAHRLGARSVSLHAEGMLALPTLYAALWADIHAVNLSRLLSSYNKIIMADDYDETISSFAFAIARDCPIEEVIAAVEVRCVLRIAVGG